MRRLLVLLVVGMFLVGCGGSSTTATAAGDAGGIDTAEPDPAASAPAVTDDASAADPTAPFGSVTTVGGVTLDGADYAGESLALWFWAPW